MSVIYTWYINHIDSGFVTHHRKRGEKNAQTTSSSDSAVGVSTAHMSDWRQELKVTNDKILVAFAWVHDEDLRSFKLFPELLAIDTTFGLNKQRRPLLVAVGIDGSQKSYIAFQAFMPSKQARAYNWALNVAMQELLGVDTLTRTSIICTDEEDALYSPLRREMIPTGFLSNAKHRLDMYHIFSGPYAAVPSDELGVKNTIQRWISSFFDDVETEDEFRLSYTLLLQYIDSVKERILETSLIQVEKIVSDVYSNIKYLGNHHFMNQTTFGFRGDSIAESVNSNFKTGSIRIDGKLSLEVSAERQLAVTNQRTQKKNR